MSAIKTLSALKNAMLMAAGFGVIMACSPVDNRSAAEIAAQQQEAGKLLDPMALDYLKITLEMGQKEDGYVDAYYGPAEYQEAAQKSPRALVELESAIAKLKIQLNAITDDRLSPLAQRRKAFLLTQLTAADTRQRMIAGETLDFRAESMGLFGTTPELKPLSDYDPVIAKIEKLVPGDGPLPERIDTFENRYNIPKDRLQVVFDAAIAECKKRTEAFIDLPKGERFTLEFVTDKNWSGYNYYQGQYESLIQVNTDLPIRISRAIDLGCHEGYPGHHTLNMLLEKNLTNDNGWQEFSVYPLYSPQSLIAEGSANYGIELAFPDDEKIAFEKDTLYPLAGLDPQSAQDFVTLQNAKRDLAGVRFTIASQYLNGEIKREEAIELTQKYQLVSKERAAQTIGFTDQYRSYVINYGLGLDMVRAYIERSGADQKTRWQRMEALLSEPSLPSDLK